MSVRYVVQMVFVAVLFLLAGTAQADFMTVPIGLNPGDQYRLAFVTSGTGNAVSTNIDDYNLFVTAQANLSPELQALGTNWKVFGSTLTVAARDNTGTNPATTGVPVFRGDGQMLAANNADLWDGTLRVPLSIMQSGLQAPFGVLPFFPFTGTTQQGQTDVIRPLGSIQNGVNQGNWTDGNGWIVTTAGPPSAQAPFFAVSGVLTVQAVPEPCSLVLLGTLTSIWSFAKLRRRVTASHSNRKLS